MSSELVYKAVCVLFVVVGIVLMIVGFGHARDAKESLRWPTVPGKVTVSEMEIKRTKSATANVWHYDYRPKISFEYSVDGASYTSNRVAIVGA